MTVILISCVHNTAQTFDQNLMKHYGYYALVTSDELIILGISSFISGYFINLCLMNIYSKTCLEWHYLPCPCGNFTLSGKTIFQFVIIPIYHQTRWKLDLPGNFTCPERPLCLDIKGGRSRKVSLHLHENICFISSWCHKWHDMLKVNHADIHIMILREKGKGGGSQRQNTHRSSKFCDDSRFHL